MQLVKRLLTLALAPLMLFGLQIAVAQADSTPAFNGIQGDMPTLTASTDGQTFATSVSATAGSTVFLQLWDHNSVPNTTAHNVRVKITLPSGAATTQTVTASLSADNAAPVSGSATVSTGNQPARMDYIGGSAQLYRLDPNDPTHTKIVLAHWPTGVNPDDILTTGINLGDQQGCWQFAQAIILKIVLTPQGTPVPTPTPTPTPTVTPTPTPIPTPTPTPITPTLEVTKLVRRAGSNQDFISSLQLAPGTPVEYQINVRNLDASTPINGLNIKDILPDGISYSGFTVEHVDGSNIPEPDKVITSDSGLSLTQVLPSQTVQVSFVANTDPNIANGSCVTNKVIVSAGNASNSPQSATAQTCFVTPSPTPTPVTPAAPTPPTTPQLPRTGPEAAIALTSGLSGLGYLASRFYRLKQNLKKSWQKLDIL